MRFYIPLISALFLTACASAVGTPGNAAVKVLDAPSATKCSFIGDVHGTSPGYGLFAAAGLDAARNAALTKAGNMGANAIVWTNNETSYGATSIHGNAYRCP